MEDGYLNITVPSGDNTPYTAMLKELTETLVLIYREFEPTEEVSQVYDKLSTLLNNEIDFQLMVQEDLIRDYKKNRKVELEEVTDNVVPLKK